MKLFKLLLALLVITALVNGTAKALTNDISPSIGVIRDNTTMKKCSIVGKEVYFSEDDFVDVIGSEFNYLTVLELPDKEDGVLTVSGVNLIKGQTLSFGCLGDLKFVPAEDQTVNVSSAGGREAMSEKQVSFTFTPAAKGWENTKVKCVINILPTLNFAPVASDMSIKTTSDVPAVCEINAYDPDGDEMTVVIDKYPANGTLKIGSDDRVIYTPEKGYAGSDAFVFYVTDGYGNRSANAGAEVEVSSDSLFFEDMKDDPLHYAAVKMAENNVMTYAERSGKYYFLPGEQVDRIDFTVMVLCAASLDGDVKFISDSAFADDDGLSSGRKAYLALAHQLDVVTNTNGYFRPLEGIRRCDAAEMVKRALKIDGKTLEKIVKDSGSESVLTRAEAAGILYNIKQYTKK